jgi:hypothetical protein
MDHLIFTCLKFTTVIFLQSKVVSLASNPQPAVPGLCIYVPSNRVAQFYSQALDSLFVVFYDLQGYGGGILTCLHMGHCGSSLF